MEYIKDELMKEAEPDWNKWVHPINYLERWLTSVDLGKPPNDEGMAREEFGLGWSSEDEREEVEAQEDFDESEIEGLLRTHTRRPPRR